MDPRLADGDTYSQRQNGRLYETKNGGVDVMNGRNGEE